MSSLPAECGMMHLCSSLKSIARLRYSVIMQFLLPEMQIQMMRGLRIIQT
jgi:hypothetical protein